MKPLTYPYLKSTITRKGLKYYNRISKDVRPYLCVKVIAKDNSFNVISPQRLYPHCKLRPSMVTIIFTYDTR